MGRRLAKLFDAGTDALIEKWKRTPNEAEDTDLQDFEDGAAEQFERWFPQTDLPPWAKMGVAGVFICSTKWVGAEKTSPPPGAVNPGRHLQSVPDAAMNTPPPPAPPIVKPPAPSEPTTPPVTEGTW